MPLASKEVQRLQDALAEGKVGRPYNPEIVALRRKLNVMLQVAVATENRRSA